MEEEEGDQYEYESTSLQSLKAFEWLSLNKSSSSSDDAPPSVVRIPRSHIAETPPPSFLTAAKEKTEEKGKIARGAFSAPRPRAVLSSPYNDGIVGSKVLQPRKLFSGQKKKKNGPDRRGTSRKTTFRKSEAGEEDGRIRGQECKTCSKCVAGSTPVSKKKTWRS